MLRSLKKLIELILLFTVLSAVITIPAIYNQVNRINKVSNTIIKYAQKNGGFMSTYDIKKARIVTIEERLVDLLEKYDLKDCVELTTISFYPGIDIPVQKRERFEFRVKPIIKIKIPFANTLTVKGNYIKKFGYSHKYFKP